MKRLLPWKKKEHAVLTICKNNGIKYQYLVYDAYICPTDNSDTIERETTAVVILVTPSTRKSFSRYTLLAGLLWSPGPKDSRAAGVYFVVYQQLFCDRGQGVKA